MYFGTNTLNANSMGKAMLFLALAIFIACGEEKSPPLATVCYFDTTKIEEYLDTLVPNKQVCYNYKDEVKKFRFSDDSIEIRLQHSCLDNSLVERVSQNFEGKFEKYFYHDYKITVNFIHPLISGEYSFTKDLLIDSLNNDWIKECILGNSLIDGFDAADTSVLISPFIGYPDTDNGVVANLKIGYNSGIKIINIVEPAFE